MEKLPAIVIGLLIVLLTMPGDLGLLWGSTPAGISLLPYVLTLGALVSIAVIAPRIRTARQILRKINPFFLVFLALAALSVLWSAEPGTTLRRLYRLYILVFTCLAFVLVDWTPKKFSKVVLRGLTFVCLASIISVYAYPAGAIEPSQMGSYVAAELIGAWRGVTQQKNTLGSVASVATILWTYMLATRQRNPVLASIGLVVTAVCLLKTRSSTSIFATIFAVSLLLLITHASHTRLRRAVPYLATALTVLFLVYSLAVLNLISGLSALIQPFVNLAGKDMSFSGRTQIWDLLKAEIDLHPWFGIGYASYWTGMEPGVVNPLSPSYAFIRKINFYPFSAHNGYMDTINELGFIGGAALVAYIITFLRQSLSLLKIDRSKGVLFLTLLFYEFIANLSEAHWWNLTNYDFLMMTLATFDIAKSLTASRSAMVVRTGLGPRPSSHGFSK